MVEPVPVPFAAYAVTDTGAPPVGETKKSLTCPLLPVKKIVSGVTLPFGDNPLPPEHAAITARPQSATSERARRRMLYSRENEKRLDGLLEVTPPIRGARLAPLLPVSFRGKAVSPGPEWPAIGPRTGRRPRRAAAARS